MATANSPTAAAQENVTRYCGLDRETMTIDKSEVVKARLAVAAGHRHVDVNPVVPVPIEHSANFSLD